MSDKHTPGPWYWCDGEGENDLEFLTSQSGNICEFGNFEDYYPSGKPPNEANARLIAAAPDLLEALEALRDNVGNCICYKESASNFNAWEMAAAAIAKAKGEQP